MTNYITLQNGIKWFTGKAENPEAYNSAVTIAKACHEFRMDVEDEIVYDDETTCYNCRYRRWNPEGFTCYKQFPNISLEGK
jgi:hypothetical protein